MKKSAIFILIILIFPIISAVEFDMKEEYSSGETIIAKVSGNFLKPVLRDNIIFKRDHVRVPFEYDLLKINGEYYIYALLTGKTQNNYSITIEEVSYMQGARQVDDDLVKTFVINNQSADFSVKPGAISTSGDFFLEVQNLKNSKITVDIGVGGFQNKSISDPDSGFFASLFESSSSNANSEVTEESIDSIDVISGDIAKINFKLKNVESSELKTITLSTADTRYEIPVYIFSNEPSSTDDRRFKFGASTIRVNMSTDYTTNRKIHFYNLGDDELENITFSVSNSLEQYITLSIEKVDSIDFNESVLVELLFTSDSEAKSIQGDLIAEVFGEEAITSQIFLDFIKDYIPSEGEENQTLVDPIISQTCKAAGGAICKSSERCTNTTVRVKGDVCCFALCEDREGGGSSSGKIIGWTIVGMIVVFLLWFFISKYRGAKKNKTVLDKAKDKKAF